MAVVNVASAAAYSPRTSWPTSLAATVSACEPAT
jgi:hypothetical protein